MYVHCIACPHLHTQLMMYSEEVDDSPLREGDLPCSGNVENKTAKNLSPLEDVLKQLFANMHLSDCRVFMNAGKTLSL